jgi:hypothetical protein
MLKRAVTWFRQLWQAPELVIEAPEPVLEMVPVTQVAAVSQRQQANRHPTKRGSEMVRHMGATRL